MKFLVPNGAQEKAIREVGNLENFIVILAFANGVGKTAIVFAIAGAIMWGAPTTAFDYPLFTNYPKKWPKRIRIVTESELVSDTGPIQEQSKKWWPHGRYQWSRGGKQYNKFCQTDTGFLVEVMTFEQAVKEFEGKTIGPTIYIEPPPRDIFNACVARQRMGGFNLLDMTPLTSSAWVMDELVSKPEIFVEGELVGKSKCITADIEENCFTHGKNGQLDHKDILTMISRYDEDEKEARAHGRFMHLSGVILKGFSRDIHVAKEEFECPNENVGLYSAVDPAIGKPCFALFSFIGADKVLHIYDEYPNTPFFNAKDSNLTVKDYVEIFRTKEGNRNFIRILDRHFGNAQRTLGGLTLRQEFSQAGLGFIDSYHVAENLFEVETGILKIKEFLKYDKTKPIDSLNRPKIVISPRCRNLITAIERWSRDPDTQKPLEEFKDPIDCLRYLVMADPEVYVPRQWGGPSGFYGVGRV